MLHSIRLILTIVFFVTAFGARADERAEFFEKKVRPILVEHCYKCHSNQLTEPKSDLRVDGRAQLLKGGARGPAIVPGDPVKSRLIEAILYKNVQLHMPPKGKLPELAIADLSKWIADGAVWPGGDEAVASKKSDFDLAMRKRDHWAWQPCSAGDSPTVAGVSGKLNPVDAFVLSKLEAKGLKQALPADLRTLTRRIYFDLIGLPPKPEEIEAVLRDCAIRNPQSAIESLVDRLLESPQYGERWARHWLDLVRYAESRGHEFDHTMPNAWQYRDYVIRAINSDVSYQEFVFEHIAGDLMEKPRLHADGFNESILGTGFWFLGEEVHSPVDIRQDQADRFDNRIDVFSKTFLGMTVACARCHDHKFDAISTQDYYALFGYLASSNYRSVRFDHWEHNRKVARQLWELREKKQETLAATWAKSIRPQLAQFRTYLLASYGVLRRKNSNGDVSDIAKKFNLNADTLLAFVSVLRSAASSDSDPLHLWAKFALDPEGDKLERWRKLLKPMLALQDSSGQKQDGVVLDYGNGIGAFLPDDIGFGNKPTPVGAARISMIGGEPQLRFGTRTVAEKDRAFDGLTLASGTEGDAGALANPGRAGRTIRTPTFAIESGKVHFLMRGTAQVYAAVAQHVMIAGPLHGRIVRQVNAGSNYSWQVLDLTPYRNLPVHLEFTAEDNSNFALVSVVQSDKPPAPSSKYSRLVVRLDKAQSLDELVEAYQTAFEEALDSVIENRAGETSARLANWIAEHSNLVREPDVWKASAESFLKEEAALAVTIRKQSRLALAMQDGPGFDEHVFVRGQPNLRGEVVPRRFLEALGGATAGKQTSGRLQLAQQVVNPKRNPLVARVFVNRVWHHLFGRGLVASVDNFGVLGDKPTHLELLDFLADWFVKNGWSPKKLIKMLVLTKTYQSASQADERAMAVDPGNLLLQHANVRRLEGEAIRDSILSISGRLNAAMYGAPVLTHLSPFQDGRGRPASGPIDGAGRRSVYLSVRRNFLSSFMLAFDTPTPFSTMGRRTVSNVPAQALILMNDPFVQEQASLWAKRIVQQPGSVEDRIRHMYMQAFGRLPTARELDDCRSFLTEQSRNTGKPMGDASLWADLAHVLINAKEFVYLE